jgi:hypothetical protein
VKVFFFPLFLPQAAIKPLLQTITASQQALTYSKSGEKSNTFEDIPTRLAFTVG